MSPSIFVPRGPGSQGFLVAQHGRSQISRRSLLPCDRAHPALACKKDFPVFVDQMRQVFDGVAVSAGGRGTQIVLAPADYLRATGATIGAIASFRG